MADSEAPLELFRTVQGVVGPTKPVVCPAGFECARGILCRIEDTPMYPISPKTDPATYYTRCTAEYIGCPTWRKAKEIEWSGVSLHDYKHRFDGIRSFA